jgi:hypothetical protein
MKVSSFSMKEYGAVKIVVNMAQFEAGVESIS